MTHPSKQAIFDLLSTGRGSAQLEAHLASCDACAEMLHREARIEEQLHEVATIRRRTPRAVWFGGAALAAAASVLFFIGSVAANQHHHAPTHSRPSVTLAALDGQAATLDGGVSAD